jgi:hypothetical protein
MHGQLTSCEHDGKIYFAGTDDGTQRNIVQVYNANANKWQKPIFLNKRFVIRQMLWSKRAIEFLATEIKDQAYFYSRGYSSFDDPFRSA